MRLLTTVAIALIGLAGMSGCGTIRGHHLGARLGAHIGAEGCSGGNCGGCSTGDCGNVSESSCGCGTTEGCDGGCGLSSGGLLGNLVGARPIRDRLQGVGCGAVGCGLGGRLCGRCMGGLRRTPPVHPYGGQAPCSQPLAGPQGQMSPTVGYPYYTTRGPRDFFLNNPPSLGR